jgi:hypothetical protein
MEVDVKGDNTIKIAVIIIINKISNHIHFLLAIFMNTI